MYSTKLNIYDYFEFDTAVKCEFRLSDAHTCFRRQSMQTQSVLLKTKTVHVFTI